MIALAFLKRYWLEALVMLGVAATGYYVYNEIKDWQAFAAKAGADAARVAELEGVVAQRDQALLDWQTRKEEWDKAQKASAALAAQQDIELAAARRNAENNRRKYREALEQLDEAARACADRRVPAVVDGMLGR
jgi:multidrug resistance efflux pump